MQCDTFAIKEQGLLESCEDDHDQPRWHKGQAPDQICGLRCDAECAQRDCRASKRFRKWPSSDLVGNKDSGLQTTPNSKVKSLK